MARRTKNKDKVSSITINTEKTTTNSLKRKQNAYGHSKSTRLKLEREHSSRQHLTSRGRSYRGEILLMLLRLIPLGSTS